MLMQKLICLLLSLPRIHPGASYFCAIVYAYASRSGSWIEEIHIFIYAFWMCHVAPLSRSSCCTLDVPVGEENWAIKERQSQQEHAPELLAPKTERAKVFYFLEHAYSIRKSKSSIAVCLFATVLGEDYQKLWSAPEFFHEDQPRFAARAIDIYTLWNNLGT